MSKIPSDIAFIAEAGAGKDFSADYVIRKYGYSRYAFADNVKKVAEKWFPELYGDRKEKPRWLLQKVATMLREIDEDVWIKALFRDIAHNAREMKRLKFSPEFIVITDCRMPNEYNALREKGYTFIRVVSNKEVRQKRMNDRGDIFNEDDMNHHSESFYGAFDCDYTIENNGTPEDLYKSIDEVMKKIGA